MSLHRLIIFTRYPVPGKTKTRLIPALGEQGAADLQREMTEHTLGNMAPLLEEGIEIEVRYEGGEHDEMARWLGQDLPLVRQGDGNLGASMERAFQDAFLQGVDKAVLVGSDCPDLAAGDIREALNNLDSNPVVLGPAVDGGYYLIGMKACPPVDLFRILFSDIPWGTEEVLSLTVNSLARAGISVGLLDEKDDVDEPKDLIHWERIVRSQNTGARSQKEGQTNTRTRSEGFIPSTASISVIIPTLNEEEEIVNVLRRIKEENVEIVVADGGSSDRTLAACRGFDVTVVHSRPGRAVQMNAGAAAASGQVLLFLHADTRLPVGFPDVVRGVISSGAMGGAFSFGTDWDTLSMRFVAWGANLRSRLFGIIFGDQGIFVRADIFRKVGGFPELPIMEDCELVRTLKKTGNFSLLRPMAITSARRWKTGGVLRTTVRNIAITWLYLLGARPEKLYRWYQKN